MRFQPYGTNSEHFKLKIILFNRILSLKYLRSTTLVAKIQGLVNQSLWQRFNSALEI